MKVSEVKKYAHEANDIQEEVKSKKVVFFYIQLKNDLNSEYDNTKYCQNIEYYVGSLTKQHDSKVVSNQRIQNENVDDNQEGFTLHKVIGDLIHLEE